MLSKGALETVLSISGVEEEHREAFAQRFEEEFGPNARIAPQNLVDKRKLEVCTPEVKIQVPPQRGDLVETRIIDGVGYILIRPRAAWRSTACRCGSPRRKAEIQAPLRNESQREENPRETTLILPKTADANPLHSAMPRRVQRRSRLPPRSGAGQRPTGT